MGRPAPRGPGAPAGGGCCRRVNADFKLGGDGGREKPGRYADAYLPGLRQRWFLPCEDLGGRRTGFEAFEVPVDWLPSLRYAWAYVRHRGMICLNGRTRIPGRVMLRHRCDPTGWAQLKEVGAGWC